MSDLIMKCSDERRRQAVRDRANTDRGLNGIDYVEVVEGSGQRQLCVHFFGDVPEKLDKKNVRIEGGARIRDIKVLDVTPRHHPDPKEEDCLLVTVDKPGDFSCYKLCLYRTPKKGGKPDRYFKGMDPRYACATFSFKTDCSGELDCKDTKPCPVPFREEPDISYLARDYASFRQLILDRLALLVPDWRERHIPDVGVALAEVLAYAGDHLSYYQDAVATEAYLDTARERESVRRHALLVNYAMHEGCNARAWVTIEMDKELAPDKVSFKPGDISFITGCSALADWDANIIDREHLQKLNISASAYEEFEPLVEDRGQEIIFYKSHSRIKFYTWGDTECCLPRGTTRATLRGRLVREDDDHQSRQQQQQQQQQPQQQAPQGADDQQQQYPAAKRKHDPANGDNAPELHLKPGDVLIFEEIFGAKTGAPVDADPARRWAVRLTKVTAGRDPLAEKSVVEIEWAQADALPFELCLSARLESPDCSVRKNVSVARGNVLAVDHGRTVCGEDSGTVESTDQIGDCACEGSEIEISHLAKKFQTTLEQAPLTFGHPPSRKSPASRYIGGRDPREASPAVVLCGHHGKGPAQNDDAKNDDEHASGNCSEKWQWLPRPHLLASAPDEQSFVVEMSNERCARLRFGDGECGKMPEAGTNFTAKYRIGNGRAGNVGAETITYMVTKKLVSTPGIRPRNPFAAAGGLEPEPLSEVKLFAPGAFRKKLERAITAEDYATLAMANEAVQRAAGSLRWCGSWREACVDIDPFGSEDLSGDLRSDIGRSLYRYRRLGHDLRVNRSRYVPLYIELSVRVAPNYLRGHVEAALRDVFSDRVLAGGRLGFFHPDKLSFGDGIHLSALVAAASVVEGVVSVDVTRLQRFFERPNGEIEKGILPLGPNEIAQLDNDPNFPERGKLSLKMKGGR